MPPARALQPVNQAAPVRDEQLVRVLVHGEPGGLDRGDGKEQHHEGPEHAIPELHLQILRAEHHQKQYQSGGRRKVVRIRIPLQQQSGRRYSGD